MGLCHSTRNVIHYFTNLMQKCTCFLLLFINKVFIFVPYSFRSCTRSSYSIGTLANGNCSNHTHTQNHYTIVSGVDIIVMKQKNFCTIQLSTILYKLALVWIADFMFSPFINMKMPILNKFRVAFLLFLFQRKKEN